jgi:hypothetical protein
MGEKPTEADEALERTKDKSMPELMREGVPVKGEDAAGVIKTNPLDARMKFGKAEAQERGIKLEPGQG